jgi:transposase
MQEKSPFGRRYDSEFKASAVALVRSGKTLAEVARDLGVSTWALSRWVQAANGGQAQSEPKTLAAETDEQRELRRLRQENAYLRQQRDILKKALGILSAEMPPNATR